MSQHFKPIKLDLRQVLVGACAMMVIQKVDPLDEVSLKVTVAALGMEHKISPITIAEAVDLIATSVANLTRHMAQKTSAMDRNSIAIENDLNDIL